MEPLNRKYRAKVFPLVLSTVLLILVILVLAVLSSTVLAERMPTMDLIIGSFMMIFIGCGILLAILMLFSRLHLFTTSESISVQINLFRLIIYRAKFKGLSWHPISLQLISQEYNNYTPYRIEVTDHEGERLIAIGYFLCWIYGVDCL